MKKLLIAFAVILLTGAGFALQVDVASAQEEGAVVIQDAFCLAFLPPAPPVTTTQSQAVITPSGHTKLTCHFEGPPIAETVVAEDFLCSTFIGLTTESHFVYTKSGRGTLVCHINPGG